MYQTKSIGTVFCVYFYQRKTEQKKKAYQGIQIQNWIHAH